MWYNYTSQYIYLHRRGIFMDDTEKRKAAKQYLMELRYMSERIGELEKDIEAHRNRLILPARPLRERVSGSRMSDMFEQKMAESLDKQLQHDELVFKYLLKRDEIVMQILEIEEPMHARLLYEMFCKFKNMTDAAKCTGISRQYASHEITSALVTFYNLWLAHLERKEVLS